MTRPAGSAAGTATPPEEVACRRTNAAFFVLRQRR